jgi:ABC-type polysaccharide/polyol phosphate transport system ATPase subunit
MQSSIASKISLQKLFDKPARPAVACHSLAKRFYLYEHRTNSLRELFIRAVLRRPIHIRHPYFALTDFNLRVQQGESVALIGTNGSGKSTVLRLIAGIYPPSEGIVETNGKIAAVIELGAGFHPDLTGTENIALYGAVLGFSRRETKERFSEIVSFAEIGEFINTPVKYYSSGMQARLAFAVAVCAEPDILLLDEVLAVGDESFRQRCLNRLRAFHERGGTLIIVSHDLSTIRDLCTRAIWMDHGVVKMMGEVNEVIDTYLVGSHRENSNGYESYKC